MMDAGHDYLPLDQLRLGLYVELELGWMAHPFPKGSFKITAERQIEIIRTLGLSRIRFVPSKSDPPPGDEAPTQPGPSVTQPLHPDQAVPQLSPEQERRRHLADVLALQRQSLARCDQQFGAAIRLYHGVLHALTDQPGAAAQQCRDLVDGMVGDVMGEGESSIRLLSEGMGDRAGMHPVNVTVLSVLLGKALLLDPDALHDLGCAAFLHDIGKTQLSERVRWQDERHSPADVKAYQEHVAHGQRLGMQLGMSPGAQRAISEHHEMVDASGFPQRLAGDAISLPGRILALVNAYENLCNPSRPSAAVTPHEALALLFTLKKSRFDAIALAAFIRMMGVYPPGSVVQLSNDRFALVVSVNSTRPLKPRVIVHEPTVPPEQAIILDLEQVDAPAIRRSVKPTTLPRAAIDYLSPRQRIRYFFERAVSPNLVTDGA